MYKKFTIKKQTGSYADTIEMFGLANLIYQILERTDSRSKKIEIIDLGTHYEVKPKIEISEDMINSLSYFPLFKWVIRNHNETFEGDYFDYPKQKEFKKERQELIQKARNEYSGKENKTILAKKLKEIERIYEEEKKIEPELDVYSQIVTPNNINSFIKLYENLNKNQERFSFFIRAILDFYSNGHTAKINKKDINFFTDSSTALQIYNPTSGKGVNKTKATGASTAGVKLNWISETMKISGALTNMLCQLVKMGSKSWDLKIVVPDFKKIEYGKQRKIMLGFKKNIKGNTPLKIDILNLLIVIKKLIENAEEYKGIKPKNVLSGLHSTYQKDLGQNKAVVNIAKLQTPEFIEFNTKDEAKDWIEILDEQINIIGSIDEFGDATQGLLSYRTFLTSSHFDSWIKFSFWFSSYIMMRLTQKKYARTFKVSTLNKFFNNMNTKDFKISEIIENQGFQKVAYAIRKSTVTLQYTPKESRQFEIRYGLAQTLQNKSKTPNDLAAFIGDFIATYNAETARKNELKKGYRKSIKQEDLNNFYYLLDNYPSKTVGALLASYGFALEEKEQKNLVEETDIVDDENDNLDIENN